MCWVSICRSSGLSILIAVGRDHGNVYYLYVVGQDELEGGGACFSQLLHSANITAAIGVFPASGISRGDTGNKRLAAAQ